MTLEKPFEIRENDEIHCTATPTEVRNRSIEQQIITMTLPKIIT